MKDNKKLSEHRNNYPTFCFVLFSTDSLMFKRFEAKALGPVLEKLLPLLPLTMVWHHHSARWLRSWEPNPGGSQLFSWKMQFCRYLLSPIQYSCMKKNRKTYSFSLETFFRRTVWSYVQNWLFVCQKENMFCQTRCLALLPQTSFQFWGECVSKVCLFS